MSHYEDFGIIVEKPAGANAYTLSVLKPCAGAVGDASGNFTVAEIENLTNVQNNLAGGVPAASERNFKSVAGDGQKKDFTLSYGRALDKEKAKQIGMKLSKILFRDEVLEVLGGCQARCRQNGSALRIRLDLSKTPELAALPWEYLRTTNDGNFICLNATTTLVRYLRAGEIRPLNVVPPLRILLVASAPTDLPQLADNVEVLKIKDALGKLPKNNFEVEVLDERATLSNLEKALTKAREDEKPFHILHFIGHGAFDEQKKEGVLVFEDEAGKSAPVGSETLGGKLKPFNSDLRFIFLNACEGSRLSIDDSYSSVAAKLLQVAEIPAVVAMQFSISDKAAIDFAASFYARIAAGEDLEQAVDAARQAINSPAFASEEWATPVFYLRADDGHLFDIKIPSAPDALRGHYEAVRASLSACKMVVFLGLDVNLLNQNLLNQAYYKKWSPEQGSPNTAQLCSFLNGELKNESTRDSLAGLATQLQIKGTNLGDEFRLYFQTGDEPSPLYETLGRLAARVTDQLPDKPIDPNHCALLFVTTTYDFALEKAFEAYGVGEYHTLVYRKRTKGGGYFTHRHYRKGQKTEVIPLIAPVIPNKYTNLNDKFPVILKMPGQVAIEADEANEEELDLGFAITEDDFFEFAYQNPSELLPVNLLGQINTSRHLYLGYNLQNWTLRLLWNRICEKQSEQFKANSYAVVFDEDADPNTDFWVEKDIRRAVASLDDYTAGLEKYVLKKLP